MIEKRENQYRRDIDRISIPKISIQNIDTAILTYIKDKIKPTIIENGILREVPVYYATPQIWKNIQAHNWFRDAKSNQLMVPSVVIKNTSISKQANMPIDKLDGNMVRIITTQWDKSNRYDSYAAVTQYKPPVKYFYTTVPDYVVVNYEVKIWTGFLKHMNFLLEKFIYAENAYWGGENYKFRTSYDSMDKTVELSEGENRAILSTFNMSVYGYIIPEYVGVKNTSDVFVSPAKIILTSELAAETSQVEKPIFTKMIVNDIEKEKKISTDSTFITLDEEFFKVDDPTNPTNQQI